MSESVRTDRFFYACLTGEVLDDREHHHPRKSSAIPVKEHKNILTFLRWLMGKLAAQFFYINRQVLHGILSDGHQSFFITFSDHPQKTAVEINIIYPEVNQLGNPKTRTV